MIAIQTLEPIFFFPIYPPDYSRACFCEKLAKGIVFDFSQAIQSLIQIRILLTQPCPNLIHVLLLFAEDRLKIPWMTDLGHHLFKTRVQPLSTLFDQKCSVKIIEPWIFFFEVFFDRSVKRLKIKL